MSESAHQSIARSLHKISRQRKRENLEKHGVLLLRSQVAFLDGRQNPIRLYSAEELWRATHGYSNDRLIYSTADFATYKGILRDHRPVIIKVILKNLMNETINDIVVGSKASAHKNVLKLLGCSLETEIPSLVYEYVEARILSKYKSIPWRCRLKIATEMANIIAYLHTAFSRPIVHEDITSDNIITDGEYSPRLVDFSWATPIPEGKTHVKSCLKRGFMLSEKWDVYNFGMVLLHLLTGHDGHHYLDLLPIMEKCEWIAIVDPRILEEGIDEEQILAFIKLSQSCLSYTEEERPSMTEVAKQLRCLQRKVANYFP